MSPSYLMNGEILHGVGTHDTKVSLSSLSANGEHIPTEEECPSFLDCLNLRRQHLEQPKDILPYLSSFTNMSHFLVELDLSRNNLSDLPLAMNQLCSLRQLNLACNLFTQLPYSVLNNLPTIQHLDITENQLVDLDSLPMVLPHLRTLRASGNRLERLDDKIAMWQDMTFLQLGSECGGNRLESLPDDLMGMIQLKELDVSNNQLQSWPNHLPLGLKHLKMPGNYLKDIPHDLLLQCPDLVTLDMASNRLAFLPFLHGFYGDDRSLRVLNVSNNNIYIVPTSVLDSCIRVILTGNPALEYHRKSTTIYAERLRDLSKMAVYSTPHYDFYMDMALIDLLNQSSPRIDHQTTNGLPLFVLNDQQDRLQDWIVTEKGESWIPSLRELTMRYIMDLQHKENNDYNNIPSSILDDLKTGNPCDVCGKSCVIEWLSAIQVRAYQTYTSVVCKVSLCSTACWKIHYQRTRMPATDSSISQPTSMSTLLPPLNLPSDSFEWIVAAATASAIQLEQDQALG
ncbi:uncharacterized protein BX664DRAFT_321166 [Halteromyces radiatus]|uniref:uncharacterized protein n=1 Tax=Halteromyces radiatus TaxID=101107 RepID=UPI00221ECE98|nr:uncharacterized protein BX664DRAFT_321166 [Halteromyces radiatus]KAI8099403.1 hypothetical protein BX664DRAFT_321166 [Halteromyces radiatus]